MKSKKWLSYVALAIATIMLLGPVAGLTANAQKEEEKVVKYIEYAGKITEVMETESPGPLKKQVSILVEGSNNRLQRNMIFHLSEAMPLISHGSLDFISRKDLKVGDQISVFFKENIAMTASIPPQSSPNAIVLHDSREMGMVKVGRFDKNLLAADNSLRLFVNDETVIEDNYGVKIDPKFLPNSDLMVFYEIATLSIPPMTNPEKIVILSPKDHEPGPVVEGKIRGITMMDTVLLNGMPLALEQDMYQSDDHYMIPLRQVAEALGYTVSWNNEERSAELMKDAQWTKVTIGSKNYSFAKMLIKLEKASEIRNGKTYVPVDFIKTVLMMDVEVNEGMLEVK